VPLEISQLMIRDMSLANPLWGAPRIHGEHLKLGSLGTPVTPISATARITASPPSALTDPKRLGLFRFCCA
jgi:hypothetical protein